MVWLSCPGRFGMAAEKQFFFFFKEAKELFFWPLRPLGPPITEELMKSKTIKQSLKFINRLLRLGQSINFTFHHTTKPAGAAVKRQQSISQLMKLIDEFDLALFAAAWVVVDEMEVDDC